MKKSLMRLTYTKKKNMLTFIIFTLFLLIFYRGLKFDLAENVTERIKYHAIPIAISVLYHNHPHDYTGLKAIAMPFQWEGLSLKHMIGNAKHQDIKQDESIYYWVADDKGFEDFVIASFYLFSAKPVTMYYMWFLILFFSTSMFLISFNKKIWTLNLLAYTYLGILLAISTLPLVSSHLKNGHIEGFVSIYETRYLDILSFIPMLHIILFGFKRTKLLISKDILPLFVQAVIFIFLYHCRSSLGWQILSIISILLLMIAFACYKIFKNRNIEFLKIVKSSVIAIVLLITSLFALNIYKHSVYNSQYFTEMGARTFWHNALMGIGELDPYLSKRYNLNVDDYLIADSVINFAKNSKQCSSDIENLSPRDLLNTLGGYGVANWNNYEECAKRLYFNIFNENKYNFLKLYLITKPIASINLMLNASKSTLIADAENNKYAIGWHPLQLIPMLYFLLILFFTFSIVKKSHIRFLFIILPIFVFSFIPSVAFYHAILTMGGLFVSASIFIYVMLGVVCYLFCKKFIFQKKLKNSHFNSQLSKQLSIIIPAYNEQNRIALTISEVYDCAKAILQDFEIIVIDDGSSDETYLKANKAIKGCALKATVIRREINQGVGAAFNLGLSLAKFPQLCLIPGDNAYNVVGIKNIFSQCGTTPIVISYRQNMEVRTPLRYFLSKVATLVLRLITGFKIKDAHSLYIFPVEETRKLKIKSLGYGYHLETLSRLLNRLKSFSEVPVTLNPKPDASSGVMKPKTIFILGVTISKLLGLRLLGAL